MSIGHIASNVNNGISITQHFQGFEPKGSQKLIYKLLLNNLFIFLCTTAPLAKHLTAVTFFSTTLCQAERLAYFK